MLNFSINSACFRVSAIYPEQINFVCAVSLTIVVCMNRIYRFTCPLFRTAYGHLNEEAMRMKQSRDTVQYIGCPNFASK